MLFSVAQFTGILLLILFQNTFQKFDSNDITTIVFRYHNRVAQFVQIRSNTSNNIEKLNQTVCNESFNTLKKNYVTINPRGLFTWKALNDILYFLSANILI